MYRQEFSPAVEQQYRDECARSGEPLPTKIANAPELWAGLGLYFNAWYELDRDRDSNDSGLKRISRRDITEYAFDCEFDREQTDNLLAYVRAMDNAYLEYIRARTPKPTKPGSGGGSGGRRGRR